jgi:hypothetical protein
MPIAFMYVLVKWNEYVPEQSAGSGLPPLFCTGVRVTGVSVCAFAVAAKQQTAVQATRRASVFVPSITGHARAP